VVVERSRGAQVHGGAERALLDFGGRRLRAVMLLNSSDANTLKSNCRLRLEPPELSVPPVVLCASMPLMRTRVNCGPSPRTLMLRPSPASREMETPGMRCTDSARFASGTSRCLGVELSRRTATARLSVRSRVQLRAKARDRTTSRTSFCALPRTCPVRSCPSGSWLPGREWKRGAAAASTPRTAKRTDDAMEIP
jgi:hypothetical protein